MVTRRNPGRVDGHAGECRGEFRELLRKRITQFYREFCQRMDQLQEQTRPFRSKTRRYKTQVRLWQGDGPREELPEADTGEFHPFSRGNCECPPILDFREPPLKDYDGTTDPQAHVTAFKDSDVEERYRRCNTSVNCSQGRC
ncbi:hypothetical protein SESBI_18177 [Sesbania bispinosa]|nr:hypothetical protein SESBI_18177 [Sesbania bispinosa]